MLRLELPALVSVAEYPSVEDVCGWVPRRGSHPGRWLILADIHANWPALVAVLNHARGRYDALWFMGDLVGYGPHPVPCVNLFERLDVQRWSIGNHDLGVLDSLHRHSLVFRPSPESSQIWLDHRAQLQTRSETWQWFQARVNATPIRMAVRRYGVRGRRVQVFVHACPDDPVGAYLFPSDWANVLETLRALERQLGVNSQCVWLVTGHTHMMCLLCLQPGDSIPRVMPIQYGQPISIQQGLYLINPGSVGSPRDGDPRAGYAILDVGKAEVEFQRVGYPVQAVVDDMRRRGAMYPDSLLDTFLTGRSAATRHFDSVYQAHPEGLIPCR